MRRQAQLQVSTSAKSLTCLNHVCNVSSLFYWFVTNLVITILLLQGMSVANLIIDYQETAELPENRLLSGGRIFKQTLTKYWIALVVVIFSTAVSTTPSPSP